MSLSTNHRPFGRLAPLAFAVCAATVAACSGPDRTGSYVSSSPSTAPIAAVQPNTDQRCKQFARFDELVACERSNGTLDSFAIRTVNWRVRYFVRYLEMPCDESPTVDESYVFNTVVNDLNADPDLDAEQRIAIRNAMFDGKLHCKTSQT
jgi:hypothetical protein